MPKEKDLSAKPQRSTPDLILEDPAAQHAADAFSPEALKRAAEEAAPVPPAPPAAPPQTTRTAPVVVAPKPASTQTVPEPSEPPPSATGDLQKKTIYPSDAGRRFLKRCRRTYKIAETLVAEYALEQLFHTQSNDAIAAPLRALGHGLRRSRKDGEKRRALTVYLNDSMRVRLEALHDDYDLAEGIVGGHAIDWLCAHQTEDQIISALKARGYGYYRAPRLAS